MRDVTRSRRAALILCVAGVGVAACAPTTPLLAPPTTTNPPTTSTTSTTVPIVEAVSALITTGDGSKLLAGEALPLVPSAPTSLPVVDVDPTQSFQLMDGAGAALTDSSAWLITEKLSTTARADLLSDLFGPSGAHLSYIRVPLTSSDFALSDYTFDDVTWPGGDPSLASFSIDHDRARIIPLLRQILAINPTVRIMGTAWSAPGWMKSGAAPGRAGLVGGTLAATSYDVYARYLRKVAEAYRHEGVPLDSLTLQNEPGYSPPDYAGMLLSAGDEARLAAAVGAQFAAGGITTKLLVHDHNWNGVERASSVLSNPAAAKVVSGSAFHCYGGNPSAQSTLHDRYPTKDIYFTECTGTFSSGNFTSNLLWNANTLVIGATRNWARTILLWNLALDPQGGPHRGGCSDCRGVVTIDPATGAVTHNEEYYALAHLGRALAEGSRRIASTAQVGSVRSVAFRRPDGARAVVLSNDGSAATQVAVRDQQRMFTASLPAKSVSTFTWPAPGA